MLLPKHLTTEVVRNASDEIVKTPLGEQEMDAIGEAMDNHIRAVADEIAARLKLDEDQAEELYDRIGWRLELASPGGE